MATSKKSKAIPVVVTTLHRGVFFGYTTETQSKTLDLTRARNCIYWPSSVGGFVGLAVTGPNKETKIGPACDATVHDVTMVLQCTPEAEKAWLTAAWRF